MPDRWTGKPIPPPVVAIDPWKSAVFPLSPQPNSVVVANITIAVAKGRLKFISTNSLTPKGKWSEADLDAAYMRFSHENQGKQVLLGEYLRQAEQNIGGGTCSQQALLYKALCNEFGLDTKLVRGHVSKEVNVIRPSSERFEATHAWAVDVINNREVVFDPRAKTYGAEKSDLHHYFEGSSIVNLESALKPTHDYSVIFQGSEWDFERVDRATGNLVISQTMTKPVSVEEFQQLNGSVVPTRASDQLPGSTHAYEIKRTSGQIENDWQYAGWKKSSIPGQPGKYVFKRTKTISVPPQAVQAKPSAE